MPLNHSKKRDLDGRPAPINRVISFLTLSDVFSWSSFAVINALVGLYLANRFGQDAIKFIGIGIGINTLTRGIFEIPIGMLTDRVKRDRDEIWLLFLGCFLMGLTYVLLPTIIDPSGYFALMFLFGLGSALNLNTWRKLFAKNVDKNKEGTQYGVYDTIIAFTAAIISFISGYISSLNPEYFPYVIFFLGILIMTGGLAALGIFTVDRRKSFSV